MGGAFSIWHLLVLLVVVVLIFGTKKLRNIGQDLGGAVKGFRDGMKSGESEADAGKTADSPAQQIPGTTIEGEVRKDKVL